LSHLVDKPAILLCDRGSVDPRAYMTPEIWKDLLALNKWNVADLSDYRYDGVIHLVSAADGAEKFYTLDNNVARYEDTPEKGKAVDINLRNAWVGHHSHIMIDNPV